MLNMYFPDSKESDEFIPGLRSKVQTGYYSECITELIKVWQKIADGELMKPLRKKVRLLSQISWLYQKAGQMSEAEKYNDFIKQALKDISSSINIEYMLYYLRKGAINFEYRKLEDAEQDTFTAEALIIKFFGKTSIEYLEFTNQLAEIYLRKGKYDDSFQLLSNSFVTFENIFLDELIKSYSQLLLGRCNLAKGDYKAALHIFEECLTVRSKCFGDSHPDIAEVLHRISCLNGHEGDYKNALAYEERALAICNSFFNEDHPLTAEILLQKADYHRILDDMSSALELSNKSMNSRLKIFGANNPILSMNYNNIGVIYLNQGHFALALYNFHKSLDLKLKHYGKDHPDVAINHSNIGIILSKQDNLDEALKHYTLALQIHQLNRIPSHPYILQSYSDIAWLYLKKNEQKKALENCRMSLPKNTKESYKTSKTTGLSFYCYSQIFKSIKDLDNSLNSNSKVAFICKKMNFDKNHQFIMCLNQDHRNMSMNKQLNDFSCDL